MMIQREKFSAALAATIAGVLAGATPGVQAADTPAGTNLEEIVVASTRLRISAFDSPTPVSLITSEDIEQSGAVTIADYVNQLPELAGSRTPRTTKGGIGNGYSGGNFLNLRNLGPARTLVLLDGKRFTPSTLDGYVDLNNLPTPLVSRVEVVTGGASASWGSDAVAGVANFVLDREFEGIKGSVNYGASTQGDADNMAADVNFGTAFAEDRGHLILSAQYSDSSKAKFVDRDWFKAYKVVTNPNVALGATQPTNLFEPWTTQTISEGGIVVAGPLAGYYFNADGSFGGTDFPLTGRSGNFFFGDKSTYNRLYDPARVNFLSLPVETKVGFGRVSFDMTDDLTAYLEASYGTTDTNARVAAYNRPNNLVLQRDNFYLPANVQAAMDTAGLTSITVGTAYPNIGTINSKNTRENLRVLGGLEGKFGDSWEWDVSYQYGEADTRNAAAEMPRPPNFLLAVDAVADPSNPSQPICRSTLTNPTDGCVPMSPLGVSALTTQQLGYVQGTAWQEIKYEQTVASANLTGDLVDMPAGPLSLATGVEYREEKATAVADPISKINGWWAANFKDFDGKYDVKEAYVEFGVPVLDKSVVGSLDFNVAGRFTDYSTSGSVETWKLGMVYRPVESLGLRVTRSRDIRAPNLQELYTPGVVANQIVNDPQTGTSGVRMTQTTSGNPDLDPESADEWLVGIVFQPTFLDGFQASVDYYDITIKDAIATSSSQFIIDRCYEGLTDFCSAITRDPVTQQITAVNLKPFNALEETTKGVDFELSYAQPLGGGDLNLRWMATYVDELEIVTPVTTITRAGEAGNNVGAAEGTPDFRWVATATYGYEPWTFQLKGRYISSAKVDDAWDSVLVGDVAHPGININHVPSVFYLDAYVGFSLGNIMKGLTSGELYIAAENLLNEDPPLVPLQDNANTIASGTNPFIYDVLGTTLRAGVRFQF